MTVAYHNACGDELRPPLTEGMTWRYCSWCETYVHETCGNQDCTCKNGRSSAPRARPNLIAKQALAVWSDDEVGSPDEKPDDGPHDHQEGHENMATKTAKKATKKATKAKAEAKPAAASSETKLRNDGQPDKRTDSTARRGRGELEKLVKQVTDSFADGKLTLDEGQTLTPQRVANIIGAKPNEDKPSAGAVAAIFGRWDSIGFALFHKQPVAFKDYSAKGRKEGLTALKEKAKEKAKKERAAEKA